MLRCTLTECNFAGAMLDHFSLTASLLDCLDFSFATIKNSRWEGLECLDCLFDHSSLLDQPSKAPRSIPATSEIAGSPDWIVIRLNSCTMKSEASTESWTKAA